MRFFPILFFALALAKDWVIILNSSRFYLNYRHTVNAMMIYQFAKEQGFPDERIILMLPDNIGCHPRNPFPGKITDNKAVTDYYRGDIEIDYRSEDLSPESFTNLLIGNYPPYMPKNKRLDSGPDSRVFLYMNGHGGDSYLKIQDTQVLKNSAFADALSEMHRKGRFKELLIVLDTCQAFSMFDYIELPNVHALSSSLTPQAAMSYGINLELGVSTADHFTYFFHEFLRKATNLNEIRLSEVIRQLPELLIKADIGYKSRTPASYVKLANFLGKQSEIMEKSILSEYRAQLPQRWEAPRTRAPRSPQSTISPGSLSLSLCGLSVLLALPALRLI